MLHAGCRMKNEFFVKKNASDGAATSTGTSGSSWDSLSTIAWHDAFNYVQSTFSAAVTRAEPTTDGGFLISGYFNAVGRKRIGVGSMKLNGTSAAIDSAFNTNVGTGFLGTINSAPVYYGGVYDIKVDPTDTSKHYYAGVFTTYNGATANKVAKINADGTLDTSFAPAIFKYLGGSSAYVSAVVPLNATTPAYLGKVLVFGLFDEIGSVATPTGVALLDSTGALDTVNFNPGAGGFIDSSGTGLAFSEAKQWTDGTIYVAGRFTDFNGVASKSIVNFDVTNNGNVPLAWTGFYSGFDNLQGVPPIIYDFDISSGGIIYVSGNMTDYNSVAIGRVAALNMNGSPEPVFMANVSTGFDGNAYSIRLNPSETKIAVGGSFNMFDVNVNPSVTVLNTNGTFDAGFASGGGALFAGLQSSIVEVEYDATGNIFAAGAFDSWGGSSALNLVKLSPAGTIDATFDPGGAVNIIGNSLNSFFMTRGTITALPNSINKLLHDNGNLFVGGYFSYYGGILANGYAKLDSNGTPVAKTVFNATAVSSTYGASIVQLHDGSGDFYHLTTEGSGFYYLYKMEADGDLAGLFTQGLVLNTTGTVIAVDDDDNLYVGGDFTTVSGTGVPTGFSRIDPTGAVDLAFNAGLGTGFDTTVRAIEVYEDTVYLGGSFTTLNGAAMPGGLQYFYAANRLTGAIAAEISAVGSGPDATVYAIKATANGVFLGGDFANYNGNPAAYLVKASSTDASHIPAFDSASIFGDAAIRGIDIGLNGDLLISGSFTNYGGSPTKYGAVVNATTSAVDPNFRLNPAGATFKWGYGFIPKSDGYVFYGLFNTASGSVRRGFGRFTLTGSNY